MERKLVVIAIQEEYLAIISKQIKEIVGDMIKVKSITVKDITKESVSPNDVVLLSGIFIKELILPFIPVDARCVIAKRAINIVNLRDLIDLPKGQNILIVNDNRINTKETLEMLTQILFEHHYLAYDPEHPFPEKIDYVVTPGEKHLVPKAFAKVIDIGPRVLDLETLLELFEAFGLQEQSSVFVKRYIKSLVSVTKVSYGNDPKAFLTESVKTAASRSFEDIVASSLKMKELVHIAQKVAKTHYPVLITGEKGTGKTMLAEAIHNHSAVSDHPFVTVNCSMKNNELLEEELFGVDDNPGLVELAHGGTLFIKEIDHLPHSIQKRVVQYLENNHLFRIGKKNAIPINVRLIATSNSDLNSLVQSEAVVTDLYYYLAPFSMNVPSFNSRKEDLEPLIDAFLKQFSQSDVHFSIEVLEAFHHYHWPGNVRELYNVISYCVCLEEKTITKANLPLFFNGEVKEKEQDIGLETKSIIESIEKHGFLDESIAILTVFENGKKMQKSFGRIKVRKQLEEKGITLTDQQLRSRMEVLGDLGLLLVRQGRAGSTISREGSFFLHAMSATNKK
ncbi:sigma 54-interacting transcriptional regulator [Pseudalkalibacillus caeni]|nr:sigma 54-interacting transcriptional regulator [Pseudalkalibacillus caeni]